MKHVGTVDGSMQAAFHAAWINAAAAQTFNPAIAADLPSHTEDDVIMAMRGSAKDLAVAIAEEEL